MALNAGLYNTLFGLRAGAELVIMDRFDPGTFAELVVRFGIRSTVLPPAAMAMLNDSDVTDLGPLTYVRSITAPLSPLQARRFTARYGVHVLNSYGQTEIGEVIGWTAADAREHPDKVGAAGRPHPGVDIRLGEDGHLLVRPPNTATGLDDRTDDDGFVDTGDLARLDDDGFVWIEGRASDMINRGGNKVFPDAVEEVLRLSGSVDDAAVVGAPDDRLGEVPVAYVAGRPVPDEQPGGAVPGAPGGLQGPGRLPLGGRDPPQRDREGAAAGAPRPRLIGGVHRCRGDRGRRTAPIDSKRVARNELAFGKAFVPRPRHRPRATRAPASSCRLSRIPRSRGPRRAGRCPRR